jgi:enediyne biosynthesis protein E4
MRNFFCAALLLCLVFLPARHTMAAAVPFQPARPSASGLLFDRLGPEQTGLTEVNRIVPEHPWAHLYATGMGGGGMALGDVDGDGRTDVFIAGGAGPNKLYRQTGPLEFADITAEAGPLLDGGEAWATGCAMVDIEGDGDLDIFVCNYESPCQLFVNTGPAADGTVFFREAAEAAQLAVTDACATPCFCDYDRDGDLDLFLVTGRVEDPAGQPESLAVETIDGVGSVSADAARCYEAVTADGGKTWHPVPAGRPDYLLRNEGPIASGVWFRDVSFLAGITGRGEGEGAVWWDADGDGWMDIYVSNAGHAPDVLYRNQRDGRFLNVAAEQLSMSPWHSCAPAVGDFSGDALPDLFAGGIGYPQRADRALAELRFGGVEAAQALFNSPPQEPRSALFLNSGAKKFAECAWFSGVARTGAVQSALWTDADHDGWQDLILLHGQARRFGDPDIPLPAVRIGKHRWDFYAAGALQKEPLLAMRNLGGLRFEDVSGDWGLGQSSAGTAMAADDFDGDGDVDLIALAYDETPVVYRNGSVKQTAVTIRLRGPPPNIFALGTAVLAKSDKVNRWQQIMPCSGGRSRGDTLMHFGLGNDPVIQELVIRWPSGAEQRETSLIAGNAYAFSFSATPGPAPEKPRNETFFTKLAALELVRHSDRAGELASELLLPFALDRAGPGLAWSDIDGDGDFDFHTGGGAGEAGLVRRNDGQGQFTPEWSQPLQDDAASADAGAVWFDADGDNDVDLFVAGGSAAHRSQSPPQRDRLYLNDGKGTLHSCPGEAIPQDGQASSIACVADFDRDGDFDVFTGARAVPGDYGSAAVCQLLRNDSGGGTVRFTNIAPEAGLTATGMVTSAVWTDLDNDGYVDLVIAHDWGPVRIFLNRVGKRLEDVTAAMELENLSGWWQSVVAADVDLDGDMDLIAGNAGMNSVHRPPVTAFSMRPKSATQRIFLVTEQSGDRLVPQRSPGVLAAAIPGLSAKFNGYSDFAATGVEDIVGSEALESAVKLGAAVLESGVFINTPGDERIPPKFRFQPFPAAAQLAPVFGIAVSDFDGDGDPDIVLAQNTRGSPAGEGQRDGGLGALLLNDGSGQFAAVDPSRSGICSGDENRACAVTELNFDGRPDVVMSAYCGGLAAFTNTSPKSSPFLRLNLPPSRAPGTRAKVERTGSPDIVAEYAAGAGWLSQNVPTLFFGLGGGAHQGVVSVRWPDGRVWMQSFDENRLTVTAPAR